MKLEYSGPVVANGPGAVVYLGEGFREHPFFPFEPGEDEFRALLADDCDAVVLVDADRDIEFPLTLTLHDPESYRLTIDPTHEPDPEPDTMTHTDPPEPDRSTPRGDDGR